MSSNHNIAIELAKQVLEQKLKNLEDMQSVGNPHGDCIEYIARVKDHPDGHWQFYVKMWHEEESETPDSTKVVSLAELVTLIATIVPALGIGTNSALMDYVKTIDPVKLRVAREDAAD